MKKDYVIRRAWVNRPVRIESGLANPSMMGVAIPGSLSVMLGSDWQI
ncbi:hypothetical protein QUF72_18870 [Desulfobacterales bacterium HSG2]|nr:hypothetical protein [Desulfobacterales bacterium HSG2]